MISRDGSKTCINENALIFGATPWLFLEEDACSPLEVRYVYGIQNEKTHILFHYLLFLLFLFTNSASRWVE